MYDLTLSTIRASAWPARGDKLWSPYDLVRGTLGQSQGNFKRQYEININQTYNKNGSDNFSKEVFNELT